MNKFDLHVGRINAQYEDIYSNVSVYDISGTRQYRKTLENAVIELSDEFNLWIPLEEFIQQHPDVTYHPALGKPIQVLDEWLHLETWLLRYHRFTGLDRNRCYDWHIDYLLTPDVPYGELYFYLLLYKTRIHQIPALLTYQSKLNFQKDTNRLSALLTEICTKLATQPDRPPLSREVRSAIQQWHKRKIPHRYSLGRKSDVDGGGRQRELAIHSKLLKDSAGYKATYTDIAEGIATWNEYNPQGVQKILSALNQQTDSDTQFTQADFTKTRLVLEKMLAQLERLENETLHYKI